MPEVRLIDKSKLQEYLAAIKPDEYVSAYGEAAVDVINHVEKYVSEMPTIEPEVRHGRWIFSGEETMHDGWTYRRYKCTECGFSTVEAKNFCPNCGSKNKE